MKQENKCCLDTQKELLLEIKEILKSCVILKTTHPGSQIYTGETGFNHKKLEIEMNKIFKRFEK